MNAKPTISHDRCRRTNICFHLAKGDKLHRWERDASGDGSNVTIELADVTDVNGVGVVGKNVTISRENLIDDSGLEWRDLR